MAAMPVMGFCIVPFAVIALLLTPLGLDGWAWRAAAWWMEWVLSIASSVSGLDGAVSITAQWPQAAMLALTSGGLWLCLSRAPWRLAGFISIPIAALLVMNTRPPVLFVSATGTNAGIIAENEAGERALYVHAVRREKFAAHMWEEAAGFDPERERPQALSDIFECDESGCRGAVEDRASIIAAFVSEKPQLAEDCQRAALVVAFFPVNAEEWRGCRAFLIDRRSVWRRGAHAVWVERDGKLRVETASDVRGQRPWTGGG
jgi:competence protein ComEC